MTKEEILEYNKRCAEFLGAIYSKHAEAWGFGNAKNIGSKMFHGIMYENVIQAERFEKELKFHSDWNWIMEVVEAIEKLGYFVMINKWTSVYTGFEKEGKRIQITTVEGNNKLVNTIQAINQFLIWYNKNNKK